MMANNEDGLDYNKHSKAFPPIQQSNLVDMKEIQPKKRSRIPSPSSSDNSDHISYSYKLSDSEEQSKDKIENGKAKLHKKKIVKRQKVSEDQ